MVDHFIDDGINQCGFTGAGTTHNKDVAMFCNGRFDFLALLNRHHSLLNVLF